MNFFRMHFSNHMMNSLLFFKHQGRGWSPLSFTLSTGLFVGEYILFSVYQNH